ncbi:MAG TPA: MEKHLA domain-containing protein, partial [Methylophilaceae bacterium]|nr:MEKHLA domain-containing protein [Methylophilaceae bacterium]
MAAQPDQEFLLRQTRLLCASYAHWTGKALVAANGEGGNIVQRLWQAPFAVVSHGTQSDPIFNYGNACALELFGMDWQQFTCLPSRLSAEPLVREERERLLERVTRHGFVDDYAGMRIARDGTRFMIQNA